MRLAPALLATAVSALLYGLAFPPLEWEWAAFVALAPLFVALRRATLPVALLAAFLWAELASLGVARALPEAVETYFLQPRWLAWLFAAAIWGGTGSVYYLGFAAAYRAQARLPTGLQPLLAAAAWVSFELARGRLLNELGWFVSNPWALAGYSQVGFPALAQVASLTGIYGVSFVLAAVNAALAELWLRRSDPRGAWRVAAVGVLPLGLALAYGAVVLREAHGQSGPAVTVAAIQADVDIGARFRPELYGQNLDEYLGLTLQAIDEVRPALVFWPEVALTFHLEEEPLYRQTIARVLREGGTELVAGGPWGVPGDAPLYTNSVFVLRPDGEVAGRYDKQVLVPFAEYAPAGGLDFGRRSFGRLHAYSPGARSEPLPTRAGLAGVAVCNEIMLPELVRRRVLAGAEYLLNPSNDTWISERNWSRLTFHMARMRAIEQRRYLVRASTSGPSAIVDPWGRVEIESLPVARAVIAGKLRARNDRTLYARLGDAFALSCVAATGLAVLVGSRRSRGGHRPAQVPREPDPLHAA
jgi:apolipoprotein N-acyltransferase